MNNDSKNILPVDKNALLPDTIKSRKRKYPLSINPNLSAMVNNNETKTSIPPGAVKIQPKNKVTPNVSQTSHVKHTPKRIRTPLHIYNPGNFIKHDTSNLPRPRFSTNSPVKIKSPQKRLQMPIIINTVSLSSQNKISRLGISSEITIRRTTGGNRCFKRVSFKNETPKLTIKNSKGEIQKLQNVKKPIVMIDLDEEDEIVKVVDLECDKDLLMKFKSIKKSSQSTSKVVNPLNRCSNNEVLNIEIEDSSDCHANSYTEANESNVIDKEELSMNKKSLSSDASVIISDEEDMDSAPVIKVTNKSNVTTTLKEDKMEVVEITNKSNDRTALKEDKFQECEININKATEKDQGKESEIEINKAIEKDQVEERDIEIIKTIEKDHIEENEKDVNKTTEKDKIIKEAIIVKECETSNCKSSSFKDKGSTSSEEDKPSTSKSVDNENEFIEIYNSFLQLCLKLDETEQMKTIVNKRLVKGYKLSNPKYTSSKYFKSLIEQKMKSMSHNPTCLFIYIKQVVDELKAHRITEKTNENEVTLGSDKETDGSSAKIRKLEKCMHILNKEIQKLEEQDVGSDDDDESAYIKADKYKMRLVKIYSKICKLKGEGKCTKAKQIKKIISRLPLETCKIPSLSKELKRLLKKENFPDLYDILQCIKKSAKNDNVKISENKSLVEARSLFFSIGNELQQTRRLNEYNSLYDYVKDDVADPADNNPDLEAKLLEHKKISIQKENYIIHKYALREANSNPDFYSENEDIDEDGKPKRNEVQLLDAIINNYENTVTNNNTANESHVLMEVDVNLDIPKVENENCVSLLKKCDVEMKESNISKSDSLFVDLDDSDVEFVSM